MDEFFLSLVGANQTRAKEMQLLNDLIAHDDLPKNVVYPAGLDGRRGGFTMTISGKDGYSIHVCCPYDREWAYAELAVFNPAGEFIYFPDWDDEVRIANSLDALVKEIEYIAANL